jgi:hypothetical protein
VRAPLLDVQSITTLIDHKVLALDETEPLQLSVKSDMIWRTARRKLQGTEAVDSPRLLRAGCKRPHCRAAEKREDIASSHLRPRSLQRSKLLRSDHFEFE